MTQAEHGLGSRPEPALDPGPEPVVEAGPGAKPAASSDTKRESRAKVVAQAIGAGLAIAASLPPWGWWPVAFIGIALLDRLIADQPWRTRFARTWLVAAAWLYPAMLWMWDLTAPGYVVAGGLYAAYFATAAAMTPPGPERRLVLPLTIALAELARWSWPFGGVPLAHLAMSQVESPVAQMARIGGSLAVVVAVVIIGQALAALVVDHQPRVAGIGLAVVLALMAAAALHPRAEVNREVDIALVQGGGRQRTRASSIQQPIVLSRQVEATRLIDRPVDLIIWPENVVNPGRFLAREDADSLIRRVAAETGASVLAGWFYPISDRETVNYQSIITPDGAEIDRYDKVRIVPFGEYVPLRGLIETFNDEIPGRDVVAGTAEPVLDTPVGPVGVAISWEGFFEARSRAAVRAGAELLTNPTNGSSYWLTQIQTQQVASNQLRAIENDRWVLQVAPTGFSALVDPDGNVIQRSGISERAALVDTVEMRRGQTLGTRLGFWPFLVFGLAAVAISQYRWHWAEIRDRSRLFLRPGSRGR
ncbi:MAG: apolipoprotein N-acyltransferase [Actinomycetia bacterium]|nr:apolipoprotein N-acyltransferase [Actinomycetes bacterium]